MGQIKFVTAILLTSMFAFALVSYIIGFGIDNSAAVDLGNETGFVKLNQDIGGNLTEFYKDVNSSSKGFSQSTIEASSDTLKSPSVFQMLFFVPKSIYSIINLASKEVFGPEFAIFFTIISAFMVFLGVLYIWKTFRGEPE